MQSITNLKLTLQYHQRILPALVKYFYSIVYYLVGLITLQGAPGWVCLQVIKTLKQVKSLRTQQNVKLPELIERVHFAESLFKVSKVFWFMINC